MSDPPAGSCAFRELLAWGDDGDDAQPGAGTRGGIGQCRKPVDPRRDRPRCPRRGRGGNTWLRSKHALRGRGGSRNLGIRRTDTHTETRDVRAWCEIHDRASGHCGNDWTRRGADHRWGGAHRAVELGTGRDVERHVTSPFLGTAGTALQFRDYLSPKQSGNGPNPHRGSYNPTVAVRMAASR